MGIQRNLSGVVEGIFGKYLQKKTRIYYKHIAEKISEKNSFEIFNGNLEGIARDIHDEMPICKNPIEIPKKFLRKFLKDFLRMPAKFIKELLLVKFLGELQKNFF